MGTLELGRVDAVTLDAFGTLLELVDPAPRLLASLDGRADEAAVRHGLEVEFAYYRAHVLDGRDAQTLHDLRVRCAGVFLDAAGVDADAAAFSDAYQDALRFVPIAGAAAAVARLRALGLALAVVSNWDIGLRDHLRANGFRFDVVVTAAEVGARKPDPRVFVTALEQLGVQPSRALHVGDEDGDERGARAAGMWFAPAPVESLFE